MTNMGWLLFGPLVGAVVLVGLCSRWTPNDSPKTKATGQPLGKWGHGTSRDAIRSKPTSPHEVGPVNYDFSKSFASTITALGALLATVLANKDLVIGAKPFLDAGSFAALSVFFALLVVIAPLAYVALSKPTPVKTPIGPNHAIQDGVPDFQSRGTPSGLLIATLITVWAVFGQVVTLYYFLHSIASSGAAFQTVLLVVLILALLVVVIYVWHTIPALLNFQARKASNHHYQTGEKHSDPIGDVQLPLPMPYWHLL